MVVSAHAADVQASRNSNLKITYGEAYQRVFPRVTEVLS
jgi:hypothetical protein